MNNYCAGEGRHTQRGFIHSFIQPPLSAVQGAMHVGDSRVIADMALVLVKLNLVGSTAIEQIIMTQDVFAFP